MVLKTDTYTDGSGKDAAAVVKGTVNFDAQGMNGVAPFATLNAANYSGLMYNIGTSGDFDIKMDFTINSNSFGPVSLWLCSSSSANSGNVLGMNFTDTLSNVYVANPSFAWIEQAVGAWRLGNSTVRIVGKYTSGPTLTLSIYDGVTLKKTVPIVGANAFSGSWFGPANSDPLGNRIRSFSYEDGTVAPPAGGSVKPSLNDAMYTWEHTSGPDNSHFSINDLLWANGSPATAKGKTVNDQLYKRFNSAATPHSTINDRIYALLKAEVGTVGKSQTINDLLYLKKKAGPPS